eukprot:2272439-Rhodomonas_salina.1
MVPCPPPARPTPSAMTRGTVTVHGRSRQSSVITDRVRERARESERTREWAGGEREMHREGGRLQRERETARQRDRDRDSETETETKRKTERQRDRDRDRETERQRDRETERETQTWAGSNGAQVPCQAQHIPPLRPVLHRTRQPNLVQAHPSVPAPKR